MSFVGRLAKAFTVEAGEDIFEAISLCHSLPFQTNIKTVILDVKGGNQVPTVTAFHRIYSWELLCQSLLEPPVLPGGRRLL